MKVRAKNSGGVTQVKVLAKHPMESGQRKDSKGNKIPAHYIQDLTVKHGGNTVFVASLGPAISKNPYVSFSFKGAAKGDSLDLDWVDNKGKTATAATKIK